MFRWRVARRIPRRAARSDSRRARGVGPTPARSSRSDFPRPCQRCRGFGVIDALARIERRRAFPDLGADHRLGELDRLEDDAGPHEYLVGAIAFLTADRLPDLASVVRVPDFTEGILAQVPDRRPLLAYGHIAVGMDHGSQHPRPAGDELPLLLCRLELRPLQ